THQSACEIVGVYAKDWNLITVPLDQGPEIDLSKASADQFHQITQDGSSNKESDWFTSAQ
ncbi:MAG: hypothetical protein HOM65_16525, partial [Verrucomicrobia bacterium]|nr:hypothetical protein [Verrucomicrobiota bacterium]